MARKKKTGLRAGWAIRKFRSLQVENMSGLSNFVPILVGSKNLCSELQRIHDVLSDSSGKYTSVFGDFSGASSDPLNSLDIIESEILSNLESGRLESHVTEFLGYISQAQNIVDNRPKYDKWTLLETRWSGDIAPNYPNMGICVPLSEESTGASGDFDLQSTNAASAEEENMPLVTKAISHRQCCHPDINARWFNPASIGTFPGGAMRMRLVTTMALPFCSRNAVSPIYAIRIYNPGARSATRAIGAGSAARGGSRSDEVDVALRSRRVSGQHRVGTRLAQGAALEAALRYA
ncbi:hypothetical protein GUJ93_ZPchr0005g14474 [Zizania palustris]|uniref:Uncharacterized protein n=1 Tax=Zizania palustris TaxID=103762 RepID=A0A8J5VG08_ZIZPA|nr:hypothetical protein GUJ93_ZPchr0005g14474 [Zizania palustris]